MSEDNAQDFEITLEEFRNANKDELYEFALGKGVELDMTKDLDLLRDEVLEMYGHSELVQGDPEEESDPEEEFIQSQVGGYLKNVKTGHVFRATPLLIARGDLYPCTKDGKRLTR